MQKSILKIKYFYFTLKQTSIKIFPLYYIRMYEPVLWGFIIYRVNI